MSAGDTSVEKLRELARKWPHTIGTEFSGRCVPSCEKCAVERLIPAIVADRDRLLETFENLAAEWSNQAVAYNAGKSEDDLAKSVYYHSCADELESAIRAAKGGKG